MAKLNVARVITGRDRNDRTHQARIGMRGRARYVECDTCGYRKAAPIAAARAADRHLTGRHGVGLDSVRQERPASAAVRPLLVVAFIALLFVLMFLNAP
ncbi:hypothetical protein [Streptomyces sp. MP131-18]|uniref:hypothetical protein n=1 Tax=Streptomyces sp. MP131-18 TaxID=1857892 RepID=UPI00097C8560|nr:hypothetical protein [Streptomyces sp. MP131-18]ONK12929.1 hypothetical protein STBA_36850 [Streptomyces sp. MP131-18]